MCLRDSHSLVPPRFQTGIFKPMDLSCLFPPQTFYIPVKPNKPQPSVLCLFPFSSREVSSRIGEAGVPLTGTFPHRLRKEGGLIKGSPAKQH
ncbi:hypothetical protein CEXT_706021 [Caerostris extrusa]|uniref:Uncharacterized protein n=1 Tax=Caerostris extrusa TaxID=172846 RepID=A0AAV4XCH9_CAEEX|nr:hypothetical protein CEXT_706021 [Caerostris extrusa]